MRYIWAAPHPHFPWFPQTSDPPITVTSSKFSSQSEASPGVDSSQDGSFVSSWRKRLVFGLWEFSWALDSAFNEVKTTPTQVRKCFRANSEMITSERAEGGLWLLRKTNVFFPPVYFFLHISHTDPALLITLPSFIHYRYAAPRQITVCTEMK